MSCLTEALLPAVMTMPPFTTMMLAMVVMASALSLDAGEPQQRPKRQSGQCEKEYSSYRTTHTLCQTDNPNAQQVELSQELKTDIVNYHNELRVNITPSASDMMKLVWDVKLERTAKKWAMQCPSDHDNMKDRMEPEWRLVKVGQNIGMGHATFRAMVWRFYTEKDRLNYVYGGPYLDGAGHFYQIVTAKTNRIGCGQAFCPSSTFKTYRVCNYAVALNADAPPYISGKPCSSCPNHCSNGNLCDCQGKLCYNNGHLNPATCQCECQEGRTGDNCEQVDCSKQDPFSNCRNGLIPSSNCGVSGVVADPFMCPHLCGLCGLPCNGKVCYSGFTLDTDSCQCKCNNGRVVNGNCENCLEIQCGKNGYRNGCACSCTITWTGLYCESCLTDNEEVCGAYGNDSCSKEESVRELCPNMCQLCPSHKPGTPVEEIPADYDENNVGFPSTHSPDQDQTDVTGSVSGSVSVTGSAWTTTNPGGDDGGAECCHALLGPLVLLVSLAYLCGN